jgi:GDPmannose 4,6-dehydratase
VRRKAIIVGSAGQDGRLLAAHLAASDYEIVGVSRSSHDISNPSQVQTLVREFAPDEIYYLAAYHHSAEAMQEAESELLRRSYAINVVGLGNFLNAILDSKKECGTFYASSSHVFAGGSLDPLDEECSLQPVSIYALTKQAGMQLCAFYRAQHGLRASTGILFNHESPLRASTFLSKQIAMAAARISRTGEGELVVGTTEAVVDWGAAEDFVDAMRLIVQLPQGDDFVIATGHPHTVADFARVAFERVGLDYRMHLRIIPSKVTRPSATRIGNPAKLTRATGWRARTDFREMVENLVDFELAAL